MKRNFTQSFKIQAVEKALNRGSETSLKEVSTSLGIGFSTLNKWIVKAKNQEFETVSSERLSRMVQEKRPQDWLLEERLNIVVACAPLTTWPHESFHPTALQQYPDPPWRCNVGPACTGNP